MQISTQPFSFSFLGIGGWEIDLDHCDVECFALERNRDHSVIFEIASKYCILKEISPGISLEGMMLKLKLQYFGHLMRRLIGKDSDAGRDLGQEEKGTTEDEMAGWHH